MKIVQIKLSYNFKVSLCKYYVRRTSLFLKSIYFHHFSKCPSIQMCSGKSHALYNINTFMNKLTAYFRKNRLCKMYVVILLRGYNRRNCAKY